MKTILLFIFLISTINHILGQEINSYDFDINIDVRSKQLYIKCKVDLDFMDKDSIPFILWKNSVIHSVTSQQKPVAYYFDTLSPSPVMFIPNGGHLTLVNPNKNKTKHIIDFDYVCNMDSLKGWAKSFTEDWIELNLYSGWYPVCWNSRKFKSKIKLTIDDDYIVTGSGIISEKIDYWEMKQPWLSNDNVIIASENLKSKTLNQNNAYIEVIYSDFSDKDADSVLLECDYISKLYQDIYGSNDSTYFKFVIIPYMRGGYARKNFATMRTKKYNNYLRGGIAHEMAHQWWTNANSATWEDWLNEAFAEYSMLIYFRDRMGSEEFETRIEKYKSNVQNTPPVWGIDRNIPEAYTVLYEKGALILYELEGKLGQDHFCEFLKRVLELKIETTNELLDLMEKEISKEIKQWLEIQLRTA